ncbi:methyltransferase [Paractinoplanes atraurantiacus]|uniref:Methyltransferase small domain-containing protein n=1 Tax=Paractinoplanes atraurantiacus TaxID=1036182 RepID=A0A285I1Z3_9ACTN|nr:methyltransferase [Actinoplanes atraurantiacus]SNY41978.1 Methyltransferase small domain-containing protein [Actinoplanes atraurantiacus]
MTQTAPELDTADAALVSLGRNLEESRYTFATVTPATHERVNRRSGNARAFGFRDVFGWSRPFGPGVLPDRVVGLMDTAGVLHQDGDEWRSTVRFSMCDNGLFVHSASPDRPSSVFYGACTRVMARAVAAHIDARVWPVRRAVDIRCGIGARAIAVARRRPGAAVLAADSSDEALRFARVNAALARTPGVRHCPGDQLDDVGGTFDLIVSCPPFMIDPARRAPHHLSTAILDQAAAHLAPHGSLVLFSGAGIVGGRDQFQRAAAEHLTGTGLAWTYRELDPDVYGEELDSPGYCDAERIALVMLVATRGPR